MPELPEVETVRRGLEERLLGRRLERVRVLHPRVVRRQAGGGSQLRALTTDRTVAAVLRRGKYLWLAFAEDPDHVLVAHLGMSGQFRTLAARSGRDPHLRAVWGVDDGTRLGFRDQRTFGWLLADRVADGGVPEAVAHIARDPFDPQFDDSAVAAAMAGSRSGIKRVLLAQTFVSGIGNIYADEALWRARVHPETPAQHLGTAGCGAVLASAREVMAEALAAGGTSFDPLYVAVNGESGWFARSLDVYGRTGEPCPRCGAAIVRERFTNRSSHRCPVCQPA